MVETENTFMGRQKQEGRIKMASFREQDVRIFDLFEKQWALVTAGSMERHNGCTVGWGCLGTIWNRPTVTVFLHPARYTSDFLRENDLFTVCFFPDSRKQALGIMGSRSGRDGDKESAAGLTPIPVGGSVGYREASLTLLCRKLYQHPFDRESLAPELQAYYQKHPMVYPPDENGNWQPHWVFVGELVEAFGEG